jgi:hypothetical protein
MRRTARRLISCCPTRSSSMELTTVVKKFCGRDTLLQGRARWAPQAGRGAGERRFPSCCSSILCL